MHKVVDAILSLLGDLLQMKYPFDFYLINLLQISVFFCGYIFVLFCLDVGG